jgi:hypothetical protein
MSGGMVLFNETGNVTIDLVNGGQAIANGSFAQISGYVVSGVVSGNVDISGTAAIGPYVSTNPIYRELNYRQATKEILARVEAAAIANPDMVQAAFRSVQNFGDRVVRKKYSELLIKHGASTQEEFIFAVEHNHSNALRNLLLDYDIDIAARDESGDTPLIKSVKSSFILIVRELVAAGADVDVRDAGGKDIFSLVQGRNGLAIIDVLEKARVINADELLSEKEKKALKYVTIAYYFTNYGGENYRDDAKYAANREKAIELLEKLSSCDKYTQDFLMSNSFVINNALSSNFRTWNFTQMQVTKILVNLAYHYGDKISGIAHLWSQDPAKILSVMNSLFDGAGNLVCHSMGEYAARVVAKTPEMKVEGEDGELVIGQNLWKNITSFLAPSDIVLSAGVTPADSGHAAVTLVGDADGDARPYIPDGDGMMYGPASLE